MLTVLFFEFTGKSETFYDKKLKRTHYNLVLSHGLSQNRDSCEQQKTFRALVLTFLLFIFMQYFDHLFQEGGAIFPMYLY